MKFILAFSICSWVTGFCNTTMTLETKYDSWSECVGAGGQMIVDLSKEKADMLNKDKLYISYFCNQVEINEQNS